MPRCHIIEKQILSRWISFIFLKKKVKHYWNVEKDVKIIFFFVLWLMRFFKYRGGIYSTFTKYFFSTWILFNNKPSCVFAKMNPLNKTSKSATSSYQPLTTIPSRCCSKKYGFIQLQQVGKNRMVGKKICDINIY